MKFEDFINIMKKDPVKFCLATYTVIHEVMLFLYEASHNLIL